MLDQFYSIINIRREGTVAEVEVVLNPANPVFQGHFPGMPVVPGVCTLMMVKEGVEKLTNKKYTYHYINSCKFLSAIRPEECQSLRFILEWDESSAGFCVLQAKVFAGNAVVLKLKANLTVRGYGKQ